MGVFHFTSWWRLSGRTQLSSDEWVCTARPFINMDGHRPENFSFNIEEIAGLLVEVSDHCIQHCVNPQELETEFKLSIGLTTIKNWNNPEQPKDSDERVINRQL